ncbi:hypothetical protein C4569_03150 [Candidatus Parcubacteria bacterium]|nr:MAG: hypothetical protein C4569_03150 [Candidatus Parcubacteria bacterium]
MIFTRKKISNVNSLGQILKNARQLKNTDPKQAAQELKISKKYIEALEQGKYEDLPSKIYSKNYLKSYCFFLGVDFKKCCELFEIEFLAFQKIGRRETEKKLPMEKTSYRHFLMAPKIIRGAIIILILIASLGYLAVKVRAIFSPPQLVVTQPGQDIVVSGFQLEVNGKTDPGTLVNINDRQVILDNLGYFSAQITLKKGINIIEITAQKRYSRQSRVERIVQAQ